MFQEKTVLECKASFYDNGSKRWVYGNFTLEKQLIRFIKDSDLKPMCILLHAISGIEKRQARFLFPCLVLVVSNEKYWFASFPNRDVVCNLVELFWRESLSLKIGTFQPSLPKPVNSAIGKELIGILHESESSLINTAHTLKSQSLQLDESNMVLENVNANINVAEQLTNNMSLSHAALNIFSSKELINEAEKESACRQKHFRITFSFQKLATDLTKWEKGTLVLGDNIVLIDGNDIQYLAIEMNQLKNVEVVTSWELCLKYECNLKSMSCYLLCANLASLLKFAKSFPNLRRKITYVSEEDSFLKDSNAKASINDSVPSCSFPLSSFSFIKLQQSAKEEGSEISDEDVAEIHSLIQNLQSLAIEVGKEQRDQMEKIKSLTSDVDTTNLRLHKQNKRIDKSL